MDYNIKSLPKYKWNKKNLTPEDKEKAIEIYVNLKNCDDTKFGRDRAEFIARDFMNHRDFRFDNKIVDITHD